MAPSPTSAKTKEAARLCLDPPPSRIPDSPGLTGPAAVRTAPRAAPPLRACARPHAASWLACSRGTDAVVQRPNKARWCCAVRRFAVSSAVALALLACCLGLRAALASAGCVFLRGAAAAQTVADRSDAASVAQDQKRDPRQQHDADDADWDDHPCRDVAQRSARSCGGGRCGAFFFLARRATGQVRERFGGATERSARGCRTRSRRCCALSTGAAARLGFRQRFLHRLVQLGLVQRSACACCRDRARGSQPAEAHGREYGNQRYVRGDSTHCSRVARISENSA